MIVMLKTAVQVKSKNIHVQCQWRHLTPALLDRALIMGTHFICNCNKYFPFLMKCDFLSSFLEILFLTPIHTLNVLNDFLIKCTISTTSIH